VTFKNEEAGDRGKIKQRSFRDWGKMAGFLAGHLGMRKKKKKGGGGKEMRHGKGGGGAPELRQAPTKNLVAV